MRTVRVAEDRWASLRHIVESIAIIAAGLWAFYVFIYQERIKPASDPAALTETIEIHRLGRDARREILSIDIRYTNTGKTEIDIAADGFNVWGIRYAARATKSRTIRPTYRSFSERVPVVSRTLVDSFVELRDAAAGGKPGNHIIMEPADIETLNYVVVVPRGIYDVIEGETIAVPVKTPVTKKIAVTIVEHGGVIGIQPSAGSAAVEDDISSYFALIP